MALNEELKSIASGAHAIRRSCDARARDGSGPHGSLEKLNEDVKTLAILVARLADTVEAVVSSQRGLL